MGAQGIYISMFDEFGEGNQICGTAENQSMVPAGSGLLALDEDGTACSSDYYMRITADGGRMHGGKPPAEPLAVAVLLSATFVDESTACPESEIVVGLFTALLVIVTEPVRPPAAVGPNVTVEGSVHPRADLGVLDPDVRDGRVGERAADPVHLRAVVAVLHITEDREVRQVDVRARVGRVVSVEANAVPLDDGVPHAGTLDRHVVDDDVLVDLRTVVGSGVHGIAIEGTDDHDEMGVFIEPPEHVAGIWKPFDHYVYRTQPEGARSGPGDTDLVSYSLRKYLRLATKGNPTALLPLYAPPADVMVLTKLGAELRALAPAVLSRRAVRRFVGYMDSQRERLLGRGRRMPSRPELVPVRL